ncbi:MAG: hypothetical protein GY834_16760 [Bacteroidetes bacterium]|nr:hypothetical protein [Bacteroidota bacterium]
MSERTVDFILVIDKFLFAGLVIFGGAIYLPFFLPSLFSEFFKNYSWITAISSVAAFFVGCTAILVLFVMAVLSIVRRRLNISRGCLFNGILAFIGFVGIFFIGS